MKIKDINGKIRKILSIKKIIHQIEDSRTGETVNKEFIEVIIDGKMRQWKEWYPLDDFKKFNPDLTII